MAFGGDKAMLDVAEHEPPGVVAAPHDEGSEFGAAGESG